jgi:flagellar biosynthesis/type III secretory pathway M-ring protein FliF/YscJ
MVCSETKLLKGITMETENIETTEETTTSDQILTVAGYVAIATIAFVTAKKIVRWHRNRTAEALLEADEILNTSVLEDLNNVKNHHNR